MDLLKSQIKGCTKCRDLVASRRQAVPGNGSIPATISFVGLAPGRNGADITGIPFTRDPSGVLFRELLEKTNMKNVFITNIVKCNPKDSKGRNRTPTKEEVENCREFLALEHSKVNPHIVAPLGKFATEFFLGTIKKMRAAVLKKYSCDNYIVVPLFHPSYVIRGSYKKMAYFDDFLKLKEIIHGQK